MRPFATTLAGSAFGVGHAIGWHWAPAVIRVREFGGPDWPANVGKHIVVIVLFVLAHSAISGVFAYAALGWRKLSKRMKTRRQLGGQ